MPPRFRPVQNIAAIAQLGERQTEDLKVPGSIPGRGRSFLLRHLSNSFTLETDDTVTNSTLDTREKHDHDGIRTHNLPIRSRTPYPLGHAAISYHHHITHTHRKTFISLL